VATGFQSQEKALAQLLQLPLIKKANTGYQLLLRFTSDGLGLEPVDGRSGAVRVDFAAGKYAIAVFMAAAKVNK